MNSVILTGRLTKNPELRYTSGTQMAICNFNLAVDRPKKGEEKQADFPRVICFGKTAENLERFCNKGSMIAVQGRIQTGSYEKDGHTTYTTEVVADRIEFLSWNKESDEPAPSGFAEVEEEVPF